MPLIYERLFRVRNYECDAAGHLNSVNYLRLMQESAFDASTAAGYDKQRYAQMNRRWLIRETRIEYQQPLFYNDQASVRTWISDFRRASSRRSYEFRRAGEDGICAYASTDWVFIDTATGQPVLIPKELRHDFSPEGVPAAFPPRPSFPRLPDPPPDVFTTHRRVEWQDLDPLQHVNNAVYMAYANECGFQALAHFGWTWPRMQREGFAVLIRTCQIQYLQPAVFGDELEIATWASGVKRSTATRHYTIRRASNGALLCQAHMLGVWVELATGRPTRISPRFLDDLAKNIVWEDQPGALLTGRC